MAAVKQQLDNGTSTIAPSEKAVVLAKLIQKHMPHMELLRFVHTGSEAVHMSMRVARAFTGRQKIGKFEGNFHGGYDNLLVSGTSFAGPEDRPVAIGEGAGIPQSVLDDTIVLPFNNTQATVALIEENASDLAAVMVEPVGGTWLGGIIADQSFLEALREVTERHDILLIFDEVITGFHVDMGGSAAVTGITADLTTLAKAIGGGFPLGAFGGRRDIMEEVVTPPTGPDDDRPTIFQSGTFQSNLVSLTAGISMLSELEKPMVFSKMVDFGDQIREGIEKIGADLGLPLQAIGQGPIFGVYFAETPVRTLRDVVASDRAAAGTFYLGLVANGVFITPYHLGFTNAAQNQTDIDAILEACHMVLSIIKAD
jgi:glutamate-1-semialdehyde 2,1-aminomutase